MYIRTLTVCALTALAAGPALAKRRDRELKVEYRTQAAIAGSRAPSGGEIRLRKKVIAVWVTRAEGTLQNGSCTLTFKSQNWKNFTIKFGLTNGKGYELRINGGIMVKTLSVPKQNKKTKANSVTIPTDTQIDAYFAGATLKTNFPRVSVRKSDSAPAAQGVMEVRTSAMTLDPRDVTPKLYPYAIGAAYLANSRFFEGLERMYTPTRMLSFVNSKQGIMRSPFRVAAVVFVTKDRAPRTVGAVPERGPSAAIRELGARHPQNLIALFRDLFDGSTSSEPDDKVKLNGDPRSWLESMESRIRALPTISWRQILIDVTNTEGEPERIALLERVLLHNGIDPSERVHLSD